jgi:hypothetical protein
VLPVTRAAGGGRSRAGLPHGYGREGAQAGGRRTARRCLGGGRPDGGREPARAGSAGRGEPTQAGAGAVSQRRL